MTRRMAESRLQTRRQPRTPSPPDRIEQVALNALLTLSSLAEVAEQKGMQEACVALRYAQRVIAAESGQHL